MADEQLFLIDIDKVLREKAPQKSKYIPRFVVSYLKRIVHQDQINDFLRKAEGKEGVAFIEGALRYLDTHLRVVGLDNLPPLDHRPCTFVSNHPLGGQDGLALGYVLGSHYEGRVKYLVNDLLMNLHGLAPLFIPINKTGAQSRDFPRMVQAGFASNNHIIMFPAGLCSRRTKGVIRDLDWKKTFIAKSVEHQRDVVPIHFEGRNSDFFYGLANFCKRSGIKVNLAMLYLADEMFKNSHKTFTISIGKPIPWQTFDRTKTPAQWAEYVKEISYALNEGGHDDDGVQMM